MRYHTGSPRNTRGKYKFNENALPRCGLLLFFSALSLPSSWLVLGLAFFVVFLLSISWTHHRADRTTSKQQPRPPKTRPAPWAHVCFVSFSIFFSFHFFPSLFVLDTWYLVFLSINSCEVPDIYITWYFEVLLLLLT